MKSYKTLIVWQKSVDLVEVVYGLTSCFPEDEKFGLTSQMRRAAVSIPSNIAEGQGRKSDNELIRFLRISFASSSELETQLIIAKRLGLVNDQDYTKCDDLLTEVRMMLNKFITNLLKTKN